eukprot:6595105-Prymnesium_polylepis.1
MMPVEAGQLVAERMLTRRGSDQLREDAYVVVEVREVIERRGHGDADGVREKSRDRDEEQN